MIYIQTGAMKMLILDPAALRLLESGKAMLSPDKTVGLFYSPDPEWLAKKLSTAAKANRLDADTLKKLLAESLERNPPLRGVLDASREDEAKV